MTENFCLEFGPGCGLGLIASHLHSADASHSAHPDLYHATDFQFDSRVLVFSLVISIRQIVFSAQPNK